MALKLMYITNRPEVAQIAEAAGVDRIFVDLEYIGKAARQGGMDTVQNRHTVEDVRTMHSALHSAELLVRVNPIHEATVDYPSSQEEIDAVISAGAEIIMLPFFHTAEEVRTFLRLVGRRAKTMLLFETPGSIEHLDEILAIPGIDETYVGLNDLSLGYGRKFMFELLADGTVERTCLRFKEAGLPFGFGGIAALGRGMLPAEYVIREHYKFGSTCAILSRSFCNAEKVGSLDEVRTIFETGIQEIRAFEQVCAEHAAFFDDSEQELRRIVNEIASQK